jgi:hypothetical protein
MIKAKKKFGPPKSWKYNLSWTKGVHIYLDKVKTDNLILKSSKILVKNIRLITTAQIPWHNFGYQLLLLPNENYSYLKWMKESATLLPDWDITSFTAYLRRNELCVLILIANIFCQRRQGDFCVWQS